MTRTLIIRALVTSAVAAGALAVAGPAGASAGGVPAAPTNVTATAGNAQITVTWQAPTDTGTSPISSYTAVCNSASSVAGPTARSTVVTGVQNGARYNCLVFATNASGNGPSGSAPNSVTPTAPPAPPARPSGVVNTIANKALAVSWASIGSNGNSYQVMCPSSDGGQSSSGTVPSTTNVTRYNLSLPLTPNHSYRCSVTATGPGGSSAAVPAATWVEFAKFTGPASRATLHFTADAGQDISGVIAGGTLSKPADLKLFADGGTILADEPTTTGTAAEAIGGPTVTTSGQTAVAVTVQAGTMGTVRMTAYVFDNPPQEIPLGNSRSYFHAHYKYPGQTGRYYFDATAGQQISLDLETDSGPGLIRIIAPDGTVLRTSPRSFDGFIDTTTLPATGRYQLMTDPELYTGLLRFRLNNVTRNTRAITIGGPPDAVQIQMDGQNPTRTFTAAAGEVFHAQFVRSTIGGGTFSVVAPDGTTLTSIPLQGDNRSTPHATASVTAPVSGTYTVLIDPVYQDQGGCTVSVVAG